MKAVVAAFNQEKALVGAFSVITNLRMQFGCNFLKHYKRHVTRVRSGHLVMVLTWSPQLQPSLLGEGRLEVSWFRFRGASLSSTSASPGGGYREVLKLF